LERQITQKLLGTRKYWRLCGARTAYPSWGTWVNPRFILWCSCYSICMAWLRLCYHFYFGLSIFDCSFGILLRLFSTNQSINH